MKKYLFIFVAAFVFLSGCKDTNENLVQDRDVAVVPIMSDPSPAYFSDDISSSYVQFDISLTAGVTVEKASIEVVRGDKKAIVKDISLPATGVQVTASEVISALGISASDYNLGDIFTLYVLTTKNGKTTRSVAGFQIPVVCYFDTSMLVGVFDYESDDWGEAGTATFVADPDDPYKIYLEGYPESEGLTGNGNRIELNINPNNFRVTGPAVVIADNLAEWDMASYLDYTFTPISGIYSACDETITVTFDIKVSAGGWGGFEFIFTKR